MSKTVILTKATIIDGTGTEPMPDGAVIIEGERIKEVLDGPPGQLPAGVEIIDCQGQTLLPGLIDAHVHLGAIEANIGEQHRLHLPSYTLVRTLKTMALALDQGFTTVRDAGGADAGLRQAVAEGLAAGPRLLVSGSPLTQTGGHCDFRLPAETFLPDRPPSSIGGTICDGVTEVRRGAREQLRQGVDQIKVMAGGGAMSPTDEVNSSQYSVEELEAAVWEAESAGTYVLAHVYSPRSIMNCLQAGVRSLEHCNLMDQASAEAMAAAGAYMVPTLITYEMISQMGRELGVGEDNIRKINEARERGLEALKIALQAGVKIGSGSDLLGPMQRHMGGELELQARVLGPMGAIVAATKTNARLLRQENDLGTIEAGKLADLILVSSDPLEDMSVFQRFETEISLIIQRGRIHKNILGAG